MKRWPTKPLGDVLDVSRERIEPLEHPDTSFNYVGLENVEGHTGNLLLYQPTPGAEIKSTKNVFRPGQILFGKLRPYLNKVHLAREKGICSTDIYVLNPRQQTMQPAFAAYYLRSPVVLASVSNAMAGANLPRINEESLLGIPAPVPPLAEQERIVKLLDEADELRKLRAQADRRTAALIPALFHEMFGDPFVNPKGCKVVRLEEVTTRITDGVHLKPNYTTTGVPFISVKNITTGKLKFDDCKFISAEDHAKFTRRCKAEYLDILYTKVGATYGRPALIDTKTEFSIYVSVCLIKPMKDVIDPHFLEITLGTPAIKSQADRSIKGIGVPDLHLDQIQKFVLPLPPHALQKEFAARVTEIRAVQAEQTASRQRLEALFQSLLHRAFNGEL